MMISLKAYYIELEKLIDLGQYKDAIAHGKYILSKYPKCIEAYRIIGKSLLELKRYPEAKDIFNRILTVFPDDFVSHVGLSIISEDEKNLDLAIWHMELAFDVQPSNLAIQDELKRLFKLRDGEFPSKIRLTRGALIRMYARGELFQQAITEIYSVLAEDPKRIDLEVILARMQFLSGSVEDAVKTCNQIINKIPYCFEANQIMEKIYIQSGNQENALVFRNRLISLNPYYEFTDPQLTEDEVPENKIILEKASISPFPPEDQDLGKVWSDDSIFSNTNEIDHKENIDWLQGLNKADSNEPSQVENVQGNDPHASSPNSTDTKKVEPDSNWMPQADWKSSIDTSRLDTSQNAHYAFENDRPIFSSNDNVINENFNSSQHQDISSTEIGKDMQPGMATSKEQVQDLKSFFSELSEDSMDNENKDQEKHDEEAFPPSDWMSQFSKNDQSAVSESSSSNLPDWLEGIENQSKNDKEDESDMPSWLKDLQSEVEPEQPVSQEPAQDYPDNTEPQEKESNGWEKVILSESQSADNFETQPSSATDNNAKSDEDKIPEWVNSVLLSDTTNNQSTDQDITTGPLNGTDQEDAGIISQQTNDELLDWLRGLKAEDEKMDSSANLEEVETSTVQMEQIEQNHEEPLEQSDSDVNELAAKILSSQLLPNQKNYKLSDDFDISSDTSIEDELSSLFNKTEEQVPANNSVEELDQNAQQSTDVLEKGKILSPRSDDSDISSELKKLLEENKFSLLSAKVIHYIEEGKNQDTLLELIKPENEETTSNFSYWQCLGDVLAKMNKLNDALNAYQKAEDILIKNFSD